MIELTDELYEASIPKCCELRTLAEHKDIMLCWGLARAIEQGKKMDCGCCEFNRENPECP